MTDQKAPDLTGLPDPAGEELKQPHLDAEELEEEIGDSEDWDEASEEENSVRRKPGG